MANDEREDGRRTVIIETDIFCPYCGVRHVETDGYEKRVHRDHLCNGCKREFRVTVVGRSGPSQPPSPWITAGTTAPVLPAIVQKTGCAEHASPNPLCSNCHGLLPLDPFEGRDF